MKFNPHQVLVNEGMNNNINLLLENPKVNVKLRKENQLENLKLNLLECGRFAKISWYCKQCEAEDKPALLKVTKKVYETCGVRYCAKEKCLVTRFAIQLEKLNKIERFHDLGNLLHWIIGFEKISLSDYKKKKSQYERVLNTFMKKLRDAGIKVQAFKILDISKGDRNKEWDGKYFLHFHLVVIPPTNKIKLKFNQKNNYHNNENSLSGYMKEIHIIKNELLKNQKKKIPFHWEDAHYKNKAALFSYLSLRSAGLYKPHEIPKDKIKKVEKGQLAVNIRSGKYMLLKDICDLEFYFENFYNKRNLSFIGDNYQCFDCGKEFPLKNVNKQGNERLCPFCSSEKIKRYLPKGSIPMDIVKDRFPNHCKFHGKLERHQVRRERTIKIEAPPPPPPQKIQPKRTIASKVNIKTYPGEEIKVIYHGLNPKLDYKAIALACVKQHKEMNELLSQAKKLNKEKDFQNKFKLFLEEQK